MNNSKFISIVLPNYNHAPYLKQRIDSILNQTYQNFELILLDDCSTDDSSSILNSFKAHPKVSHVVINQVNSGSPFKQWHNGIELAQYDWIWIAESDDYCDLDFLSTCVDYLNETESELVYCQSYDVNETGQILSNRIDYTSNFQTNYWKHNFNMKGLEFIKKFFLVKNVIPNASAVVFKKPDPSLISWKLIESFKMCGDWMFWIQLSQEYKFSFVKEVLNYFRIHNASTRNHNNKEKIQQRLREEVIIRNYVNESLGFSEHHNDTLLAQKWVALFPLKRTFSKEFKSGVIHHVGLIEYIKLAIKLRISKNFQ